MAVITCAARSLAPARLWLGARRVGDFMRPASSAASDSVTKRALLPKYFLRRRLDPIGAGAEIDAVEIELEDLVLGISALEPEREDRLLDLARERALLGEEEVLGELLGQGRAALKSALPGHVAHDCPRYAEWVDAEMLIKPPVLDRDEGLGQIGREVDEPDRRPAGVAAIGDERAVVGEDGDVGRAFRHRQLVDRRQLARLIGDKPRERDHAPDAKHEGPIGKSAERGPSRPAPALLAAGLRGLRAPGRPAGGRRDRRAGRHRPRRASRGAARSASGSSCRVARTS